MYLIVLDSEKLLNSSYYTCIIPLLFIFVGTRSGLPRSPVQLIEQKNLCHGI